jgi:integrase/recombinase XerD
MPAPVRLTGHDGDVVADYLAAMQTAGRRTGRSTTMAARTAQGRISRAGGWDQLTAQQQVDVIAKARSFGSWLMVTGRLQAPASLVSELNLHLGNAARLFRPAEHRWFVSVADDLRTSDIDAAAQWNVLAKITAIAGVPPEQVRDRHFVTARAALMQAYRDRGMAASGKSLAAVFHRLQLTLFHAGHLSGLAKPDRPEPVVVTGWVAVPARFTATARRYLDQVQVSLRPNTVNHIEHDLRVFGLWLAATHPEVAGCADLDRPHIEAFKQHLLTQPTRRTGRPLNRISIKNALINLHCFFDRIADWGYDDAPARPLIFIGDLPIIDKPLPRFLDDAAAAKLQRTARADPDPLSRLIVELLARTGIRRGELLTLTVDAVVQIGSAYWLRIPIGKLHNDRYIPLHPQLKDLLDDWVTHHRPASSRSKLLLIEHNRPITFHRVANTLNRLCSEAGIGHVTAHQLRHTLATQAINRGMSLDAIAALLGHKTLAMTMVYARIADKTVAEEYFAVTEKVEALYDQPRQLPSADEGSEMRRLRAEMHRRMLGNGYCARPVDLDCHFESICESCSFFVTTIEFRPTLQAQRDDAANKGQVGRQKIFDGMNRPGSVGGLVG